MHVYELHTSDSGETKNPVAHVCNLKFEKSQLCRLLSICSFTSYSLCISGMWYIITTLTISNLTANLAKELPYITYMDRPIHP